MQSQRIRLISFFDTWANRASRGPLLLTCHFSLAIAPSAVESELLRPELERAGEQSHFASLEHVRSLMLYWSRSWTRTRQLIQLGRVWENRRWDWVLPVEGSVAPGSVNQRAAKINKKKPTIIIGSRNVLLWLVRRSANGGVLPENQQCLLGKSNKQSEMQAALIFLLAVNQCQTRQSKRRRKLLVKPTWH